MNVPLGARMAAPCIAVVLSLGVAAGGEILPCPGTPFDIRGEFYVAPAATTDGIAMTAGDWNEDGRADLAAIGGGGVLSILLGSGGYRLCPPTTIALTHTCLHIATADLDGDGHRDLVAGGLDTTTFLRGDGQGGFTTQQVLAFGGRDLTVARLGAGPELDLVLAGADRIRLLHLNGFAVADSDTIAFGATAFDFGDFDGDQDLDLVACDQADPPLAAFWGNDGNGAFAPTNSYVSDTFTESVSTGDVNGDEFVDVVGVSTSPDLAGFRFYGRGDGTFGPAPPTGAAAAAKPWRERALHVVPGPRFVVLADLNHDGRAETVTVREERGHEVMNVRSVIGAKTAAVADLNGDGVLDVAALGPLGVAVHPGQADGLLRSGVQATFEGDPEFASLLNLDGDGVKDVAVVTADAIISFLGQPGGGFARRFEALASNGHPYLFADVDNDGDPDYFTGTNIYRNQGDGSFEAIGTAYIDPAPAALAAGDLNGDGLADLAVSFSDRPNRIYIMYGDGAPSFTTVDSIDASVSSLDLVDLDGDSAIDLVGRGPDAAFVLYGNGEGTFVAAAEIAMGYTSPLWYGHVNGDPTLDVVCADPAFESRVFLHRSTRAFIEVAGWFSGVPAGVGDFDRDGSLDVLTYHVREWLVPHRGRGDGSFEAQYPIGPAGFVFADDRNGDEVPDLVIVRDDDEDGFISTVSILYNHTPQGPTPVLSIQATAEVGAGWVRLSWHAGDRTLTRARVERRGENGPWVPVGEAVFDGAGHATFVDRNLAPGRYAYRLQGAGIISEAVWAVVPGGGLRLAGLQPQPAFGALRVAFELPRAGAVRFQMFDVAGRRVVDRRWETLAAGAHVEALGVSLAPGVYSMRLEHAGDVRLGRGVVLR